MARRAPDAIESAESRGPGVPAAWPWILALLLLVFGAFAPALRAEFVSWDDEQNVTSNHEFRGLDAEHVRWMFTTDHMGPYQPLAWLSLAVDHAIWGLSGPDDFPEAPRYHLTSVAIHALATLFFFALARRLLSIVFARPPNELGFAAFVAAAFFAIHPLRVESVAWITERRDVLCGLFYVLAAWSWLGFATLRKGRESGTLQLAVVAGASIGALALSWAAIDLSSPRWLALRPGGSWMLALAGAILLLGAYVAAGRSSRRFGAYGLVMALFLCALLSKGLAMVLPAVLLVLDVWPLRRARDGRSIVAAAVEKMPLVALSVVFARIAIWGQASIPGLMAPWKQYTFGERTLQAFYGLAFYLRKTLVPVGLSPIYELPRTLSLAEPRFFLSIAAVAAITAIVFASRQRAPAWLAAWTAYGLAIAPVLGYSQAGPQIAADRYSYLACLPFALIAGAAVIRWRSATTSILSVAALALLASLTFAQSRVWKSSKTLWEHASALDPTVAMAHLNLGHVSVREAEHAGDVRLREAALDEAQRIFERGFEAHEHPLFQAGIALVHQRRWEIDPKNRGGEAALSLEFAQRALDLAVKRNEVTPEYHLNLGSALSNAQRTDEAIAELELFVREEPHSFMGRFGLGFALVRAKRFEAAARNLELAVELEPSFVNAWGNLGFAYEGLGQRDKAIEVYRRVLVLSPGHPTATARLKILTMKVRVEAETK
jgi:tetratricopeptide (TPR) repeat protein